MEQDILGHVKKQRTMPSQDLRSAFVSQSSELFSRKDVFSDHTTIVYVGSMEFRLAAVNEKYGLVRAEYRYDEENECFRLHDSHEILGAFDGGVLNSSALTDSIF